ncbi:MAG: serine/threonine-protein kinase [Gemmatimonadales bacterium]|jgi:serine/threonine-protein kinase
MTPGRRQRIESLFEAALGRPTGERARFLAGACDGDPEMKVEVEGLLAAHERAGGILESDAAVLTASVVFESVPGERIGPYRMVGVAGRGGMGVVHLAERDDGQFRRRVAIKVIRGGPDAIDLHGRFEAERHILASLDHPNIARLLDGGLTHDGRPYLVMEYIEGLPIDEYCRKRRLGVEDRLRLFCGVARAVHHAHRNLVVHRDLKPSNIFVTEDGVVKLLDFGIAKILDPSVVGHSGPATRTGVGLMTPEYASPEQITGTPITTATDIYGLGVVLYELLTGQRPFHVERKPVAEWARIIVAQEPLAPSEAAGRVEPPSPAESGDAKAESLADGFEAPVTHNVWAPTPGEVERHARRAESLRLRRRLRGDLDRIVLMTLRKEPERRYASAEQLAADIERHLDGLPVVARSESHAYRLRKFVSRHRWGVAAAAAVFVGLVGGSILATIGMVRSTRAEAVARTEAETAEQVSDFVVNLFKVSDPSEALGNSITAREILDRGADRIPEELADQPLVQARLLLTIGGVYRNLGLYAEAEPLLERSVGLQRAASDGNPIELATSLSALAHVHGNLNRNEAAAALFEEALGIRESLYGPDHPTVATTLTDLAQIYRQDGRYDEAATLLERALGNQERSLGPDHLEVASTLYNLGAVYRRQGRLDETEPLYRRALEIREANLPEGHPDVARSLQSLAIVYERQDRLAEAEPLYWRALEIKRKTLGPQHRDVATSLNGLAIVHAQLGELAEAEALFLEALEVFETALGPESPQVANQLHNLGFFYRQKGALSDSERLFKRSLAIKEKTLAADHPSLAATLFSLGDLYVNSGRYAEAESPLRRALAIQQAKLPPNHNATLSSLQDLAEALRGLGRAAEAEEFASRAAGIEVSRSTS